jgi:multiple sugar transport system permease protein
MIASHEQRVVFPPAKKNNRFRSSKTITHLALIAGAFFMLYPLLWMLSSSFKPEMLIARDLRLWPSEFTLDNYQNGWTTLRTPFTVFYINSFFVITLTVIGTVFSSALTGFPFARLNFPFKKILFAIMLATIMLPLHVTLIPRYIIFHRLGWIDTFLPLWVPHFFATSAFFVFLIVQFIRGIPKELDNAAMIDGASTWQVFRYIILPITQPALVTTAIFSFIWNWDDFFTHLLYLNSIQKWTVPLGLRAFVDSMGQTSYGQLFAMSVLSLVPIFAFFILAQRQLVEGIATTGLKG